MPIDPVLKILMLLTAWTVHHITLCWHIGWLFFMSMLRLLIGLLLSNPRSHWYKLKFKYLHWYKLWSCREYYSNSVVHLTPLVTGFLILLLGGEVAPQSINLPKSLWKKHFPDSIHLPNPKILTKWKILNYQLKVMIS